MTDHPGVAAALHTYLEETAPVVALRLDAEQRVAEANAQARDLLGQELVGRAFAELLLAFVQAPDLPGLIAESDPAPQRFTLTTASGRPETLYFRFFALPDGALALGSLDLKEQEALGREMLGLNQELNDLSRQLHQANAELKELSDLKSRFLGMAAHDLRRPIGVILTYTEFLLDEAAAQLDEEQLGFLRTCLTAATGMKRVVDNFLHVAVVDSGRLRLEPTRTTVTEIAAGVLPLVQPAAARKDVHVLVELPEDAPPLVADVAKLQQVLTNLLGNAVEHSTAGRRVWLGARLEPAGLVFTVRDEGPGISPEDRDRLFEPFGRAGTRKTAGERSVGLGLAIARQAVEAHGGQIWVESTVGQGSTFFVSLPLDSPAPSPERTPQEETP